MSRADKTPSEPRRGPAARLRDLATGVRFATSGGREGWTRNTLTAVGVGLGVALLLLAASVPQMMEGRDERAAARTAYALVSGESAARSDRSVVVAVTDTDYRSETVGGVAMRPDGARPVLPPGLERAPAAGEMYVSPALAELLASPEGRLLAERLPHRTAGLIGDAGLLDPGELLYYTGSSTLTTGNGAVRTDGYGYGAGGGAGPIGPVLIVVIVLACVVLLVPVAVFIATAVRFGGEQRDRRLAALRLVGADARTTRWIAAGEALFGAARSGRRCRVVRAGPAVRRLRAGVGPERVPVRRRTGAAARRGDPARGARGVGRGGAVRDARGDGRAAGRRTPVGAAPPPAVVAAADAARGHRRTAGDRHRR
jgi:hypothetical protein